MELSILDFGHVATAAEAQAHKNELPQAVFFGPPAECAARIGETAQDFGVEEMMILDLLQRKNGGSETYQALAALTGMVPRTAPDSD